MKTALLTATALAGLATASASAAPPAHRPVPWTVSGPGLPPALLARARHRERGTTGPEIALSLVEYAARHGILMIHATVNLSTRSIVLTPARFARSGPLAAYLPGGHLVTTDRLNAAMPLLIAAANARHERINLGLDAATMTLNPTATAAPGRPWNAGAILSSFGPRYAGADAASVYAAAHLDGWDIDGSLTRGLPGLTPKQAGGGAYLGEALSIDRPTPLGVFSIHASHVHYRTGGALRPLHLTGEVTQIQAGDKYPILDGHVWLRAGLGYAIDRQRLGITGWSTVQRDLSGYAGATGSYVIDGTLISARATLWHGIAGSDTSQGGPNVMGRWASGYAVQRVRLSARRIIGPVALHGIIGAQHGSAGTPQAMQSYIGGQHRGASFYTGSYSGPSAVWYSASVSKARPLALRIDGLPVAVTPYAGINGGRVWPAEGTAVGITSATIGLKFALAPHVSGLAGYSRTLASSVSNHQSSHFNFELVAGF